ncbi:MAG TPA: LLM class flavin-dependent oxidoreductase [Acidimicrobiales bacterium]|jgi:alkanesulfonate monooxygenase SsuD/methylene tetrahydromethanopterin reductase-like flavin-dependent oxidoreductase (luciferase family)|nr:LLM class flavin-dependent oxidoreductase [Acidimicrobiales bacterium]
MEFALFVQGHSPKQRANDPYWEHQWVLNELELIREADKHNWKYTWVSEHHFLEEYSHLSASEVFMAYAFAQTERIHLGSGIFNLNPKVNHPIKLAERVAMLDHVSEGRFEFGTGRGAGSHEIGGFDITHDQTKANWDEVIWEFRKMWSQRAYSHPNGRAWVTPELGTQGTFNVLPKPYVHTHPPMWVAAGNPPTYEKAARHGIGVLGFNVAAIYDMAPMVKAYKDNISKAEPVGDYVNDNVMIANGLICLEDGQLARKTATKMGLSYIQSLVFRYHDTFPKPEGFPVWPEVIPEPTLDDIEARIEAGFLLCGDPDEVLQQVKRYEEIGCDSVGFGFPLDMPHELALETIRMFGDNVIPKLDKDPVHRSTRFREAAGGPLVLKGPKS